MSKGDVKLFTGYCKLSDTSTTLELTRSNLDDQILGKPVDAMSSK